LKILYVIDSLSPGGAERQLVELIKGLDKSKYNVNVCCLMKEEKGYTEILETAADIKIKYFCRRNKFDLLPIKRIYNYILELKIDVVHAFLTLGALFGVIAARLAKCPVVCSGIRDSKDDNFLFLIYKKIEALLSNILVSNSKSGFINRFKVIKPHFRVIYNGIDLERFKKDSYYNEKLRNDLGLNKFSRVVGMVATLSNYKDYKTFINAASIILNCFKNTCFLIVGDGPNLDLLMRQAQELNISQNVIFTGYRSDVDKIYPIMNACVLVTRSELILEGMPNCLLESMASGVPVIASAGGGVNELIYHGWNGLLVPPGDYLKLAENIIKILANEDLARLLSRNASQDVRERFNNERYVQETLLLYHELIEDPL